MSNLQPYCIQEADLMLPKHWADQSLNVFKIPASEDAQAASFVISRDPQKGERTLRQYIQAQLAQCHEQLPGFMLRKNETFISKGVNAGWLEYLWNMEGRDMYLRQVFFDLPKHVLICTLTTNPRDLKHHEAAWREVMSSLVLAQQMTTHPPSTDSANA